MSLQECIELAKSVGTAYLATVANDQPRVRALGMWFADETGFYFQVWSTKAIYNQIQGGKKAEACFYQPAPDGNLGKMLRVSGTVEIIDDIAMKEKCMQDRPFLKMLGMTGADDPRLAIFRIADGEAYIWTADYSGREAEIPRYTF